MALRAYGLRAHPSRAARDPQKKPSRGVALRRDASADRLTSGVLLNTARFMSLPVTKQRTALLTDEKTLVNDAMKPLTSAALKAKEKPQIPPGSYSPP
ncbi:MAG: hypothetical protein V8R49_08905 [Duodenibacillus massiliensis]